MTFEKKLERDKQRKLEVAINAVRHDFLESAHLQLNDRLAEVDPVTNLPLMDVLIAYASQGWGVKIEFALIMPKEETGIEEQARKSGIAIVKA